MTNFFIFCDASKRAYGVVLYAVQNGVPQFVISKPKVTPLKNRSLQQLEFLQAIVGLQALCNNLDVFKHVDIENIHLAIDDKVEL